MSVLTNLKLVVAKKPAKQPPVVQRRNKLSSKIWEQVQLARAQKSGETFSPTRMRSVRDPDTGLRKVVEVSKRVKPLVVRCRQRQGLFEYQIRRQGFGAR